MGSLLTMSARSSIFQTPTLKSPCFALAILIVWMAWFVGPVQCADHSARARSDSDAMYLHYIDFYDVDNQRITAESKRPYSPMNTCGRCHDYKTIAHGWHFNAFDVDADAGREGEPWIWTDAATGTQLPLSYRDWSHTYDPRDIGLSSWSMTRKFGARIPGGSVGDAAADESKSETSRWPVTGSLEIDCLVCHSSDGGYDINARREQIDQQNFAWAPTAALRLGTIKGNVSRIKDGTKLDDESTKKSLPEVTYDARRFDPDGKVFVDLLRHPSSNACYQCHSQRTVGPDGVEERWIHDEDVHLQAGMQCSDCHRNGIDHDMVRGFEGQVSMSGESIHTLSCEGCHLGEDDTTVVTSRGGRLGSPRPLHEGLPPVHFEKIACTACHGGPVPREEAARIMTSLAHGLGEKGHRTGQESPALVSPIYKRRDDDKIYPHKSMWPAFWGVMKEDSTIAPLDPESVATATRKSLRVRKDFVAEIFEPKLKSADLKELLGQDRASVPSSQWTSEEKAKVSAKQLEIGNASFQTKVAASLAAIEKELNVTNAVYVSTGKVYKKSQDGKSIEIESSVDDPATKMVSWPMAHNVRPAGWSLGTEGCVECHNDDGLIFASTFAPVGPVPTDLEQLDAVSKVNIRQTMADLQGIDPIDRLAWNQLFSGRAAFKYVIAASLTLLAAMLLFGLGWLFSRFGYRGEQDDAQSEGLR
jgi:nitrate/TMAO reductase-like tetraheme cytochrome c subunit